MRFANNERFFVEVGLAALCASLALLTMISPDWIEEVFGVDPDQHSGSVEWMIVIALTAVGAASGVLARIEWRRLHAS